MHGFEDDKWRFEAAQPGPRRQLKMVGVWLTDRPLGGEEGPGGDAVVEVNLELPEDALLAYEIGGVLDEARLWVLPAQLVNPHATSRILQVDPRTSWWDGKPPGATDDL